jgi:hypothetical protein
MNTDNTIIRQLEFELEKAEHGMAMPYDTERAGQLRSMLREATGWRNGEEDAAGAT